MFRELIVQSGPKKYLGLLRLCKGAFVKIYFKFIMNAGDASASKNIYSAILKDF